MWVQCNHPGGVTLSAEGHPQVKLVEGPNEVDGAAFRAALDAADKAWVKGMTEPAKGSRFALLEPCDAPEAEADEDEDEDPGDDAPLSDEDEDPGDDAPLSAKDKIVLVMAAESMDELNSLAEGEERKTVLDALDKRVDELADEE